MAKNYTFTANTAGVMQTSIVSTTITTVGEVRVEIPQGVTIERAQFALENAIIAFREWQGGQKGITRNADLFTD